jgi:hypothetical protein
MKGRQMEFRRRSARAMLLHPIALALACDLKMNPPNYHAALISNHQKLVEQKDAADYIQTVEEKVASRRGNPPG